MSFWDSLLGRNTESYSQGQQWAETFIEENDAPEVTPGLVKSLGNEYADNETLFSDGFTDTWNANVAANGGETDDRPWWQKIF